LTKIRNNNGIPFKIKYFPVLLNHKQRDQQQEGKEKRQPDDAIKKYQKNEFPHRSSGFFSIVPFNGEE